MLPNNVYNVLKWIVITFMPAAMTLVAGLGIYLDFDTTVIVGIMGLVTTFVGTLIGLSSMNYARSQAANDDENEVEDTE